MKLEWDSPEVYTLIEFTKLTNKTMPRMFSWLMRKSNGDAKISRRPWSSKFSSRSGDVCARSRIILPRSAGKICWNFYNGSKDLSKHFKENWRTIATRWVTFVKQRLKAFKNTTYNRKKRFSLQFKLILKERRRTAPRLTECRRVFMELMDVKSNTPTYMKFLLETSQLQIYHSNHEVFLCRR